MTARMPLAALSTRALLGRLEEAERAASAAEGMVQAILAHLAQRPDAPAHMRPAPPVRAGDPPGLTARPVSSWSTRELLDIADAFAGSPDTAQSRRVRAELDRRGVGRDGERGPDLVVTFPVEIDPRWAHWMRRR